MKKLLILLIMGTFVVSGAFAQTADSTDDFGTYLELLTSGEVGDVDLTEIVSVEDLAGLSDTNPDTGETYLSELETTLEDSGIDAETVTTTVAIVTEVSSQASAVVDDDTIANDSFSITLNDAAEDTVVDVDGDGVNDDVSLDTITDGIAVYIADEVTGQLFDEEASADLSDAFETMANGINMLTAFGQANAQSSITSSLFGYQGYKLFAFAMGTSASFATDSETMNTISNLTSGDFDATFTELEDKLQDSGFDLGFAAQGLTLNLGINMGFLVDDLYLGVIFGSTSVEASTDDGLSSTLLGLVNIDLSLEDLGIAEEDITINGMTVTSESMTFGITANYQLINSFGIPILFRWNGISLGTGFIYNAFDVGADIDVGEVLGSIVDDDSIDLSSIDMNAEFSIDSTSFTIPLEVSTGVQLLSIVTLTAGAGVDVQFGSSSVDFDITSGEDSDPLLTAVVEEIISQSFEDSGTDISIPYSEEGEVNFLSPRVMGGIGVGVGPAVVDLSTTYYIGSGFTFGLNFILRI